MGVGPFSLLPLRRGLELDACDSECLRILAQISMLRGNLERAVRHQERGLFLNPNDDRSVCSMGELLAYCGKHGEAEAWVRKSMRLNPFHPQRYWTHLARPLFHLGRYQETLTALEHITRLRRDDHVYRVAASAGLGDAAIAKRSVVALREAFPDLDPVAFARAMPYEREADRQAIVHALQKLD